ncbi:Brp/Blh family beta-carotene 15,15'-dioxygenase [Solwaraspora sp. WMMA2080]|uniref:Brp/Blh family beta-carotene 15,15'-dioxygenase n=1 Tax=unclassified Solwaraspora TaxID=2627926 RepID=UPI00248B2008|nr:MULTISPECIES: Brp/Blh family beta-carotene 15,15'-dioxygenase [unclassified Solwaraspora]WBB96227.1 Brp/Blh family beta-carotene 15,15'-dioxygenase [Solwaraspora sp. WMMA2059]WBC19870.1 Brp/Blh family beta-carotene 15,15'-dioxygenase [Solwaraspora sp. WMMA2080]WJK32538.1 Brp/Blh family beta-carotene 15,15'-dioxygenase [Solwaraspora sp. WMMA2065]
MSAGRWLLRRAGRVVVPAFGAVLLIQLPVLSHPTSTADSTLPLLVGLLLGLPHGAVDHLVPAWLKPAADEWRARAGLLVGYVCLAVLVWWICYRAPGPAFVAFLILAMVHFGAGDEAFHRQRDARRTPTRPYAVLAYGAPPVLLPLTLWPDQVDPLLESIGAGSAYLLSTEARVTAVALAGAAVVATMVDDLRAGRRGDAGYLGLLIAVFVLVPPAWAFGTYFAAGHSVRHVARLLVADPGNAATLAAGRLGPAMWRFAAQAAIPTGAVLVVLVPFAVSATPEVGLSTGFAVLAGLTAPHALLVFWLDRRGVDYPAGGGSVRRISTQPDGEAGRDDQYADALPGRRRFPVEQSGRDEGGDRQHTDEHAGAFHPSRRSPVNQARNPTTVRITAR